MTMIMLMMTSSRLSSASAPPKIRLRSASHSHLGSSSLSSAGSDVASLAAAVHRLLVAVRQWKDDPDGGSAMVAEEVRRCNTPPGNGGGEPTAALDALLTCITSKEDPLDACLPSDGWQRTPHVENLHAASLRLQHVLLDHGRVVENTASLQRVVDGMSRLLAMDDRYKEGSGGSASDLTSRAARARRSLASICMQGRSVIQGLLRTEALLREGAQVSEHFHVLPLSCAL
jgi:hypothetical protein